MLAIMTRFFYNLAAVWNLLLLLAAAGALLWFLYWFLLRRLIRARRIANARERRMLREAAERETAGQHRTDLMREPKN
jgi:hypothetical protein